MNIGNLFRRKTIPAITEEKAVTADMVAVALMPLIRAMSTTGWTYQQCVDAYQSWVYIGVNKIATTVASIPLHLYAYKNAKTGKVLNGTEIKHWSRGEKDVSRWLTRKAIEKVEIEEHPLLTLLRKPNAWQTRYTLWFDTMVKLELGGQCGWYIPRNGAGLPYEIIPLPLRSSGVLEATPDPKTIVGGWRYRDGGIDHRFALDEVVAMRYPSPVSPLECMSPVKSQIHPYNIDSYMGQLVANVFANGALTGTVLETDQKLSKDNVTQIIDQINSQLAGVAKAGKPMVLHSGLKSGGQLSTPLKELVIDAVARAAQDKLLSGLGVPAGKVGLVTDVNRANMEALDKTFFQETIKPKCMLIEEVLETEFLPLYDDRLTADFDLPDVSERTLDLQERDQNLKNGYSTINEERQLTGLVPVAWGDAPWMPYGLMQVGDYVPPEAEPAAKPDEDEDAETEGDTKSIATKQRVVWDKKRRKAAWQSFAAEHARYEGQLQNAAINIFHAWRDEVLHKVGGAKGLAFHQTTSTMSREKRAAYVKANDTTAQFNIDKRASKKMVIETFAPLIKGVVEHFGERRGRELVGTRKAAVGLVFNVNDPRMQKWLGDRLDMFSDEITGTTFDDVKAILRQSFEEGVPEAEVSQRLREKFGTYDKYRAQLIARTETTAAANEADIESVLQAGLGEVLLKVWIDSDDEATRDAHRMAGDEYSEGIPVDQPFVVGGEQLQAPGEGSDAANNINCRCTLGYVEKE